MIRHAGTSEHGQAGGACPTDERIEYGCEREAALRTPAAAARLCAETARDQPVYDRQERGEVLAEMPAERRGSRRRDQHRRYGIDRRDDRDRAEFRRARRTTRVARRLRLGAQRGARAGDEALDPRPGRRRGTQRGLGIAARSTSSSRSIRTPPGSIAVIRRSRSRITAISKTSSRDATRSSAIWS